MPDQLAIYEYGRTCGWSYREDHQALAGPAGARPLSHDEVARLARSASDRLLEFDESVPAFERGFTRGFERDWSPFADVIDRSPASMADLEESAS